MYNQNNMYNNFNNTGMYNQVYQPPVNNNRNANKGGGIGSFLFALVLLVALVLLLLRLLGVFDVVDYVKDIINKDDNNVTENVNNDKSDKVDKEDNEENKKEENSEDPMKTELANMCGSLDASGNYHIQEYQNQLTQIQGKYHTIDGENSDAYFKEIEGIYACTNSECFKFREEKKVAIYSCINKTYSIITIEEMYREFRMDNVLATACNNLDSNGFFSGTISEDNSVIECANRVCKYTYQGHTKEKKCN